MDNECSRCSTSSKDEKAMIRNQLEFYTSQHQTEKKYKYRDGKNNTTQAENQEDCSRPADGHIAILNRTNKKWRTNRKMDNNSDIKPQQMCRTGKVNNKILGWGWFFLTGLKSEQGGKKRPDGTIVWRVVSQFKFSIYS